MKKIILLLFMLSALSAYGQNKNIGELDALSNASIASDDSIIVWDNDASSSKKVLFSQLALRWLSSPIVTATVSTGMIFDNESYVEFQEATGNGDNYVRLKAPASLTSNYTYEFPNSYGTSGYVLATNGSGTLYWQAAAGGVTSIFGRTGVISAAASDYDADQIDNTPSGDIAATDVQAAIDELDDEKLPLAGGTMTGDLVLAGAPDADLKASTKKYVDDQASATLDFSNKTFVDAITVTELGSTPSTPASGDKKIYAKNDGRLYSLDDAGIEIEVGSGSGTGSKNYIDSDSADLETNTGSWDTDDGAGGSASYLTIARNTTDPLAGDGDLKITKSANDASSEFIKLTTQAIDIADRGGPLYGSFDYDTTEDSAYDAGDFIFEAYDNTNAAVLYCGTTENLELPDSKGKFKFVCYTEEDTASIEVRLKVNSTNASAYDLYFDEFRFGPSSQIQAPIITEWQEYTPSITTSGGGSVTLNGTSSVSPWGRWRRVGDTIEINTGFRNGTGAGASGTAGNLIISFPSGITKATSPSSSVSDGVLGQYLGPAYVSTAEKAYGSYDVHTNNISISDESGGVVTVADIIAGFALSASASFKVEGWGSGALVGENELGKNTIHVSGRGSSNTVLTANVTPIDFTEITDDHNAWSDNNTFTAPKSDYYELVGSVRLNGSASPAYYVYINGSEDKNAGFTGASTTTVKISWSGYLNKGDTLQIRTDTGSTLLTSSSLHWIEITNKPNYAVLGVVKNYELIESAAELQSYSITQDVWGDLTSITVSEGTWDFEINAVFQENSSSSLNSIGLSVNSGSSSSGLVVGDTRIDDGKSAGFIGALFLSKRGVVVNSSTTYYLKARSTVVSGAPKVSYKISARRVR